MKILRILAIGILAIAANVGAQSAAVNLVRIGVDTEQDQYIPGEAIIARVAITNLTGRTLNFRGTDPWLKLTVADSKNYPVTRLSDVSINEDFAIANGEIATVPVDVARYYDVVNPGRYSIKATVVVREIGDESPSIPRSVEVVKGTVLWEEEFGVPAAQGTPEARRFALMQAPTGRQKRMSLFVRISVPAESRIIKTFAISRLLGFSKPEAQIDSDCNFHVLNQSGQRSFDYFVISPDGKTIIRQLHEYSNTVPPSRPRLGRDPQGKILVVEGQRRFTPEDIPSSPKPASTAKP